MVEPPCKMVLPVFEILPRKKAPGLRIAGLSGKTRVAEFLDTPGGEKALRELLLGSYNRE
jgi:hypothetical protein